MTDSLEQNRGQIDHMTDDLIILKLAEEIGLIESQIEVSGIFKQYLRLDVTDIESAVNEIASRQEPNPQIDPIARDFALGLTGLMKSKNSMVFIDAYNNDRNQVIFFYDCSNSETGPDMDKDSYFGFIVGSINNTGIAKLIINPALAEKSIFTYYRILTKTQRFMAFRYLAQAVRETAGIDKIQ